MRKKRIVYIVVVICLTALLGGILAAVCRYHNQYVEESRLYIMVSGYQAGDEGAEHLSSSPFAEGSAEQVFLSGLAAFNDQDYTAAMALFEQALAAPGTDPVLPAYLHYYINQCHVCSGGGGNAETVSSALKAIRQYAPLINDVGMLWDLISSISLDSGNDAQAIALMEEHLAEANHHMSLETWAWLKNCISMLEYNNQEYSRSIRGFYDVELALENTELTPDGNIELRYAKEYIANIYYIFEDYEKATELYRELTDMTMDDEIFHAYGCCINMASAYLEIPDVRKAREAIAILEACLPRVEADIVAEVEASMHDVLANICLMEGDVEAADAHLRQSEAFYQENRENQAFLGGEQLAMFTRCKYLVQTGAAQQAQQTLEAMAASGDAAYYGIEKDVYELLRDIYKATGQTEKLLSAYEKLMTLDVGFSQTIQREYLEFSMYYKENIDLIKVTANLSRANVLSGLITVTVLLVLVIILILLRLLSTKNLTDQLTGVYNRKKLNQLLRRYRRGGTPASFGVVMMDIDYFKRYNDTYGHPAGDEVLKQVAKVLVSSLRSKDIVIRYGGEEFLVLLNRVEARTATDICQRIHRQLRNRAIPHAASEASEYVTLSMGLCHQGQAGAAALDKLIEYADECLYQSKEAGRNRVTAKTLTSTNAL